MDRLGEPGGRQGHTLGVLGTSPLAQPAWLSRRHLMKREAHTWSTKARTGFLGMHPTEPSSPSPPTCGKKGQMLPGRYSPGGRLLPLDNSSPSHVQWGWRGSSHPLSSDWGPGSRGRYICLHLQEEIHLQPRFERIKRHHSPERRLAVIHLLSLISYYISQHPPVYTWASWWLRQ